MANEILTDLVRANVAGAAVALVLLMLRGRLRLLIGPTAVYALWLAVPAAAFASLLPTRTVAVVIKSAPATLANVTSKTADTAAWDASALLLILWLAGAAVAALSVAWRQHRFLVVFGPSRKSRRIVKASSERAGPAVVGVISPRILLPADFVQRFSPMQRRVVLAHEAVHLARGDSRINAAVLLLQCLNWFNPVLHVAARAMRLDQELSCDAAVMARFPNARRSYAEAMLKSQCDAAALPLGCYWPARGPSALSRRLSMLRSAPLPRERFLAGLAAAGLMAAGAGAAAWSAQPPHYRLVVAAEHPTSAAVLARKTELVAAPASQERLRPRLVKISHPIEEVVEPVQPVEPPTVRRMSPSQFDGWFSMPMSPDGDAEPEVASAQPKGATAPDGGMSSQGGQGGSHTYRNGPFQMVSQVTNHGDTVEVLAKLYQSGTMIGAGQAVTTPGETAYIALSNGQVATVTPGQPASIITRQPIVSPRSASAPAPS